MFYVDMSYHPLPRLRRIQTNSITFKFTEGLFIYFNCLVRRQLRFKGLSFKSIWHSDSFFFYLRLLKPVCGAMKELRLLMKKA